MMEPKIEKILEQYDIAEKTPIVFIRESSDNAVYSIGEKNKHILRISKRLPLSDVQFEFEAMEHLFNAGVALPQWIKTREGNFYASTSEIPTAVVFEFLDGIHAERTKGNMPRTAQAQGAGKALALLHNAGQNFSSSSSRSRDIYSELKRVLENETLFINEYEGGEEFVAEVQDVIDFAKSSNRPQGFIHNDYRVGNVFFQKENPDKIKGIIDFDWGCIGPLSKDFALGILEWSFVDGAQSPDEKVFEAFLDGYNSVSIHKQIDGNDLYQWIWFSGLSDTSTWLCDNLGNPDFIKKVGRSYMYQKAQYFKSKIT